MNDGTWAISIVQAFRTMANRGENFKMQTRQRHTSIYANQLLTPYICFSSMNPKRPPSKPVSMFAMTTLEDGKPYDGCPTLYWLPPKDVGGTNVTDYEITTDSGLSWRSIGTFIRLRSHSSYMHVKCIYDMPVAREKKGNLQDTQLLL
jgi:hypothetical protein